MLHQVSKRGSSGEVGRQSDSDSMGYQETDTDENSARPPMQSQVPVTLHKMTLPLAQIVSNKGLGEDEIDMMEGPPQIEKDFQKAYQSLVTKMLSTGDSFSVPVQDLNLPSEYSNRLS